MKQKIYALILFVSILLFGNISIKALEMNATDIPNNSYVIGTHVFTAKTTLTTQHIMIGANTIDSDNLSDMVIYYKAPWGEWWDGLTGETITVPETFEINYTDLQLEEENNTVSAPKAPIITLNKGAISIDEETDMMSYMLDIYIDDVDDESNKTDGVELAITDYDSHITKQDLKYSEDRFKFVWNVLESYTGNELEIGKQYHRDYIIFENTPDGYYNISARAYAEDKNGERIYSDWTLVSIDVDDTLPYVEIANDYSNPNYISVDGNFYTYRLRIEKPDAPVFRNFSQRFAYTTNCADGKYNLDEYFTVSVAENSIKKCYAQIGYYDKNGDFQQYITQDSEKNKIYFTIDTRTLTKPILGTFSDGKYGEYLYINDDFYEKQGKDTLDYQIEGTEIYRVYWTNGNIRRYEIVSDKFGTAHVFPPRGSAEYVARVYATNAEGKKVYSDFSDMITVVRTPEIEVSEVIDGNVTVKVKNIEDYGTGYGVKYKLYKWDSNNGGEVLIQEANSIDDVLTVPVTENMEIYAKATYIFNEPETYSAKSNRVEIKFENTNLILYGDVNNDGDINISDVTLISRYMMELEELNETQLLLADINSDGEVDDVDIEILQQSIADKTITLPYNSGEKYTISYNLDGGEIVDDRNITTYAAITLPYTLKKPEKAGYIFIGWTGSNGDTPELKVTITETTTGNLEYTANWEKNN